MSKRVIEAAKADVKNALDQTFELDGKSYGETLKRAKKHLPHKLKKDADFLEEAESSLKHPQLRKRIDINRVKKARDRVVSRTSKVNPAADRARDRFGWASKLVINLALAGIVYYLILRWIGAV